MRNHVGEIIPGIAKSYEISEDGKTYTFHLRDAKWSDGVEIKAQVPLQLRRNAMLLNPNVKGFETYFVGINYDYLYADIVE